MNRKYPYKTIDLTKIKTSSIQGRKSKVNVSSFADISKWQKSGKIECLFPAILKAKDLKNVADLTVAAFSKGSPVIFAIGAHVIKCGLSPIINDLIDCGIVTGIAMNGAGIIHDYEVAFNGSTSEDVSAEIDKGTFGMAEETSLFINSALNEHVDEETGIGESLGRDIEKRDFPYKDFSILYACYKKNIPCTVHVAVGTDIIHLHPSAKGEVIGKGSYNDFKLFSAQVSSLGQGGCFFNIGSSVILPEIFLKALTLTRNLGHDVSGFTTVNMDMIQHYRPLVNVVSRPVQKSGQGYSLTGHHEIMLPLLYAMIQDRL